MSSVSVSIQGLDSLRTRYDPVRVNRCALTACYVMAKEVEATLKKYPPAGEGNEPGRTSKQGRPVGYYERNRGYWSPRANIQRGSFGNYGKAVGRIKASSKAIAAMPYYATARGYVLTSHSETLGKKWDAKKTTRGATVTNSASYAPHVQSQSKQGAYFKRIGWITDVDALKKAVTDNVFVRAFWEAFNAVKGG